jgi:hypothetical protein
MGKEVRHRLLDRKQTERDRKGQEQDTLKDLPCSDLLSPVRSCLLKFLEPPKIVPSVGDQAIEM